MGGGPVATDDVRDPAPDEPAPAVPAPLGPRAVIAIFNSNEDIMGMLRTVLESEGFQTVAGHVVDIKRGHIDFVEFIQQHDPAVIVYDVVPPYEANWNFLRLLRSSEFVTGRAFVVTTTNKAVLQGAADVSEVHELIGKPYDLAQITQAVRAAVEARSGPSSPG
jgi:CheY-like chemotaxis protein